MVLMAESEAELKQKLLNRIEAEGLEVIVGKTKIMTGGEGLGTTEEFGSHLYEECDKGVGHNSIKSTSCSKWVYRGCSRVKGSLQAAVTVFVFRRCPKLSKPTECYRQRNGLIIWNGDTLESVEKFCCFSGDMLNADDGVDSAVVLMVRCAWKTFRELSPILNFKGASLKLKGKVHKSCVQSCMMYGS